MKKNDLKILLIEDEEFLGDLLVKKIKTEGYKVEWIKDGKNGLEKAEQGGYDLLLLDMMLPDINGYTVLEELQARGNKIPIIIVSNSGQPVDIKRAKEMGAADYLVKSDFEPKDVIRKIHEHLALKDEHSMDKGKEGLVMLIEDDEFLRELIIKKLKNHGYNIMTAIDGEEGLKAVEEKKPSLVLLDVIMPGMDGFDVLKKIKEHKEEQVAQTPVIMLTNLGEDTNAQKAKDLGALDYILKANLSTDDILKKVDYYLRKHGTVK